MKLRILALVFLLALTVAACGEEEAAAPADDPAGDPDAAETDAPEADDPEADEPEADEPEADEPEADEPEADAEVAVAGTEFGDVLVDGEGLTLYMFESDGGSASTCYDDCAANWPPLLTDGEVDAGDGADAALLGTAERDDGTTQVTYGGHPLYYFAGDSASGDAAGQGVGDVWWVLGADGEPVTEEDGGGSGPYGGGYGSDY